MYLFAGLGNIGDKYTNTPHNAGFMFVDQFREYLGYDTLYSVNDWAYDKYLNAELSIGKVGMEEKVLFLKPMTMMNASGLAVRETLNRYDLKASESLVVIHDDLDIPLGEYKIQRNKAPKSHNGINNIKLMIGTSDYLSVRIGVENRVNKDISGEDYVLMKYKDQDLLLLNEVISDACRSLRSHLQV